MWMCSKQSVMMCAVQNLNSLWRNIKMEYAVYGKGSNLVNCINNYIKRGMCCG